MMEMLATGAPSALLVSKSATRGLRVFRVRRDEAYIGQMLALVSRFFTTYVRKAGGWALCPICLHKPLRGLAPCHAQTAG